ncbi:MAG: hypothetical protein M5U08_06480 [Burkholderiales bacterium]|nr:hypothetical protein [Burkholderiales bacterium]
MGEKHWLVRPRSIRVLWGVFAAVLAFVVLADFLVAHDPHFGIDGTFAFAAWFGFAACVALIIVAKAIGIVLKRPDDYYRGDDG